MFNKKGKRRGTQRYRSECKSCYTKIDRRYGVKRFALYKKRHPEKCIANWKLRQAVKKGIIKKPNICTICGIEKQISKIQGHHYDYKDYYSVVWMCSKCHTGIHYMLRNNQPPSI